jgi:hypothetical protein
MLADGETLGLIDAEGLAEGDTLGDADGDTEGLMEAEGDALGETLGEADALAEGDADSL